MNFQDLWYLFLFSFYIDANKQSEKLLYFIDQKKLFFLSTAFKDL